MNAVNWNAFVDNCIRVKIYNESHPQCGCVKVSKEKIIQNKRNFSYFFSLQFYLFFSFMFFATQFRVSLLENVF